MNILVLSNCDVVEWQGSGYIIINTAKPLIELGHKVKIIPPGTLKMFPFLKNRANIYRMAIGMTKWICMYRKQLPTYDLIIFYGAESALALFFLKKILNLDIPVILHSNGLEMHVSYSMQKYPEIEKSKWYHFNQARIFKYCYSNVDAIITLSKFDYDFGIRELKLSASKMYYIEPCLPEIFFNYVPQNLSVNKPIIVYCGTWITRKGVESIKEAMPAILKMHPEYTFRIIGTGPDFKPQEHFEKDTISKIEVFPFIESKEQMIKLYNEASIFLFPSIHESFGLVVAEAMFCGCAVICGNTGFAAGVKNNEEALVLETPNAENVYEALEKLIMDPTMRMKIARNGKKRTEHLKWSNYTVKLNEILKLIVQEEE